MERSDQGATARQALEGIVRRLPGGEQRDGQLEMCQAVAEAIEHGQHLVVEAGTGVGKSLAYLVPAVLSGQRVVVATARKPLQDQLSRKDIPFLAAALPGRVDAAVLKGRSNYVCLAKLAEATGDGSQGELAVDARRAVLTRLREWTQTTHSGDLADAPVSLDAGLRSLVTVTAQECPGRNHCEYGEVCLAERALERAREASLVLTNIDLYCLDSEVGGALLGEHDAVVIDEAHELEAIATRTFGLEVGRRRLSWLASQLRGVLVRDAKEPGRLDDAGEALAAALARFTGERVDLGDEAVAAALAVADEAVGAVVEVLRKLPEGQDRDGRRQRCLQAASNLLATVRRARAAREGEVAWVPAPASPNATNADDPVLHLAPVDIGPALSTLVYQHRTAILTSATLNVGGSVAPLATRLGFEAGSFRELRVTSPFEYRRHAFLYCPVHLPDPRSDAQSFDSAAIEELAGLVEAAGGRTLALFTSHRMLRLASEALRERFPWPVLAQDGPPQPGLIEQFRDDERACLLATMGYWQGVDVPGPSLTLVVIDRLPFPSPRDPLLEARRDAARQAGQDPFHAVDLPLAATLLAQGAGRLIRSTNDRGVVAVLDRRLAKARYKAALLDALPPMRRSIDGRQMRRYLAVLATEAEEGLRAELGMPVVVSGCPGTIVEVRTQGAIVELVGGSRRNVTWGEPVSYEGDRRLLRAP